MVIGILQIELAIDGATSLKDKRSVVKSLKDRLHREHQVAVAEVATLDLHTTATLGIVMCSNDIQHAQTVLDKIQAKLARGANFVLTDASVEILSGR